MRREHRDDSLLLHGWARFFHNIAMLILYPLRKPIKFLVILAVLSAVFVSPVYFFDVKREDLSDWYKEKISPLTQMIAEYKKSIIELLNFEQDDEVMQKEEKKPQKAQTKKISAKAAKKFYEQKAAEPGNEKTQWKNPYYKENSKFGLRYLPEFLEIRGVAQVYNPNEIMVGNTYVILYGIYTDPKSQNYAYAKDFLQEKVGGKTIRCDIVAYTKQEVATAVCYAGAKSINDELVETHLAKRVME